MSIFNYLFPYFQCMLCLPHTWTLPIPVVSDQQEIWERQVFPGMRKNICCFGFSFPSLFMLSLYSYATRPEAGRGEGVWKGCNGATGCCVWMHGVRSKPHKLVQRSMSPLPSGIKHLQSCYINNCHFQPFRKTKARANADLALRLLSIPVCLNI